VRAAKRIRLVWKKVGNEWLSGDYCVWVQRRPRHEPIYYGAKKGAVWFDDCFSFAEAKKACEDDANDNA